LVKEVHTTPHVENPHWKLSVSNVDVAAGPSIKDFL
jgi:hypothetical protein